MKRAGFTIAEIVVAIGILAVVLLFLIGLVVTNLSLQEKGEAVVGAINVGETALESWKARPYAELFALSGAPATVQSKEVDGKSYEFELRVSPLEPASENPGGRILLLDLEVEWTENTVLSNQGTKTARANTLSLQSIVAPGANL